MSVAYRSATVGGRKRMDARDNPKEDERERRREQNVVETRKRRIGLIYIELYYWTSISFLSILEGRAILSQLVEFGFLWNPMEFSAWSMSLISRWELWFISFWETPTWPRVYYLNFIWDYFGLPSFLVFHRSKIFTIAEIFFDFSVLSCFSTHALTLFFNNNNMMFQFILFFKITPF